VITPAVHSGGEARPSRRACVVCGTDITGLRADARCCSGPCRAEASRIRAILNNSASCPYPSVAERLAKAHKRTSRLLGALTSERSDNQSTTTPRRRHEHH
jgi:hypothetical protein